MAKGKDFKKPQFKSTNRFEVKEEPAKINYIHQKPIFSFYHMQYGKAVCLSKCQPGEKSDVTDKLIALSQITWNVIIGSSRKSLGFETMPQKELRFSLPSIVTPEVTIEVFTYSKGGRIAGFREKNIYHIIAVGNNLYKH